MVLAFCVVTMYNYHPLRLAKSNILKQYFSHSVNIVCDESPSRMRRVRRISFGMTILPRSSTRRTIRCCFHCFSSPCAAFPVVLFAGNGGLCDFSCGRKTIFPACFFKKASRAQSKCRQFRNCVRAKHQSAPWLVPLYSISDSKINTEKIVIIDSCKFPLSKVTSHKSFESGDVHECLSRKTEGLCGSPPDPVR